MDASGEVADLMVKESIQLTEESIKLLAAGCKNLTAFLYALAKDNKKLVGIISVHTFHGLEHLFRKQAEFDHAGYPGTVGGVYRLQNGKKLCVIGAFRMHKVVVKITVFKLFFPEDSSSRTREMISKFIVLFEVSTLLLIFSISTSEDIVFSVLHRRHIVKLKTDVPISTRSPEQPAVPEIR